ncbi:P-loop NTPase fold protein [Shewanella oncorhynchi]|uniref:P-loop NTPase fold protein n=1 Tax=Shewanella TaxID=22 RepID=UPI00217E9807|nr:P-loop NTPase fold protein [Shewanella baltica]MCS6125263.1 hypothetical protein [Shewanella baltica]
MKTEERIHALLEDRSFPRMVLIDGDWGVGKTFYVKNELQPYLKANYPVPYKTIYLSLYGVTSLNDFKDRLMSLAYATHEKASESSGRLLNLLGSSTQVLEGTRGIGALLGTASSIAKQILFNKLDKLVLLLDDLERISSEIVRSEIIGECLNLTDTKSIKIVVIANQSKVGATPDIEKAFSDTVHINRTPEQLIDIVNKLYQGNNALTEHQIKTILELIKAFKLKNLRIIRRSIDRFKLTCSLFKEIKDVNYEMVHLNILHASFRTCIAINQHGYTLEEILESLDDVWKIIGEDEPEIDKRKSYLDSLISPLHYKVGANVITFIATYENKISDINMELSLPTSSSPIETMLYYGFKRQPQAWLDKYLPDFKESIFSDNKKPIFKWMKSCSMYAYMVKEGYVDDNLPLVLEKIEQQLNYGKFEYEHTICEMLENIHMSVQNPELLTIFSDLLKRKTAQEKEDNIQSFHDNFLFSWNSVREEAQSKFEHKPFFNQFTKDELIKALTIWEATEVYNLYTFMSGRYNFNNIEAFFSEELDALNYLSEALDQVHEACKFGVKKGNLSVLKHTVNKSLAHLRERMGVEVAIPE